MLRGVYKDSLILSCKKSLVFIQKAALIWNRIRFRQSEQTRSGKGLFSVSDHSNLILKGGTSPEFDSTVFSRATIGIMLPSPACVLRGAIVIQPNLDG